MSSDIGELEERLKHLEQEVNRLQEEAKEREVRQLRWGIRVLGIVVMAMASWIWTQVGHIFDFSGSGQ